MGYRQEPVAEHKGPGVEKSLHMKKQKKEKPKMVVIKQAIVHWSSRSSLAENCGGGHDS